MLREAVALPISLGALRAIAESHVSWKSPEAAWQAYRRWGTARGLKVPHSLEEKPPYFHELQNLYEFGASACPDLPGEEFQRRTGRCFAKILLEERLPDLVSTCMKSGPTLPEAIETLFLRFMGQYAGDLYRIRAARSAEAVEFSLEFADPEGIGRHLAAYGRSPARDFRQSFLTIVATSEACLEYLLDPWDPANLSSDPAAGVFRIRFPGGTKFHYRKLAETLTGYAYQLQRRHAGELFARDLEQDLVLQSPFMREKWEKIRLASATDEIILLRGEPGTGKTHLAERIHTLSTRKGRPFVEVGLTADVGAEGLVQSHLFGHVRGAFTSAHEDRKGLFEQADGGTIFLDEIGDASAELQAKLLRVIEKKTFKPVGSTRDVVVDVRVIAATNRDLERMVRDGKFREDLYHRLNVIQIEMPPLRARAEEIPLFTGHFVRRLAAELKKSPKPLAPEVAAFFRGYPWPGNFRELKNVLKHALLFGREESILPRDLPEYLSKSAPAAPAPPAEAEGVVDFGNLCRLLARSGSPPAPGADTAECPWHIDFARKTYLRAIIRHCGGNLRRMTGFWDRDSEHTLRTEIRRFGLWAELETARKS